MQSTYQTEFKSIAEATSRLLEKRITAMFENVDDAMFEYMDKASSNHRRNIYFDGMSEIHNKSNRAVTTFVNFINHNFDAFIDGRPLKLPDIAQPKEPNQLALVEVEEQEISVALTNLTSRTDTRNSNALFGINHRLAILKDGEKVKNLDNPFSPESVAHAFYEASKLFQLSNDVKLVIYAAFDRFVMQYLDDIYLDLNEKLIQMGILPNLKYTIELSPDEDSPGQKSSSSDQDTQSGNTQTLGDELFSELQSLLSGASGQVNVEDSKRQVASQGALLGAISQLQATLNQRQSEINVEIGNLEAAKQNLEHERAELFQQVGDKTVLTQADTSTIDLVGMFFELILKDDSLCDAVKALLCHLHTLYLKVALSEREIFSRKDHPARVLLDNLTDAGSKWVDQNRLEQGLYPKIHSIVNRLLKNYQSDNDLFTQLSEELKEATSKFSKRASVTEKRTQEAIRGRARLLSAQKDAEAIISDILTTNTLPTQVQSFLSIEWVDVMVFLALREGKEHQRWQEAIDTANLLARVVADPEQSSAPEQLKLTISEFLLMRGGYQQEYIDKTIEQLFSSTEQGKPHPNVDRIKQIADLPMETYSKVEREAYNKLANIEPGTWFDVVDKNGDTQRVKLSWRSAPDGKYLFVTNQGIRYEEFECKYICEQMAEGKILPICAKSAPFFERAMQTFIQSMKG